MTIEVKVPDIGDFAEVEIIEVLVKVGDRVAVEQSVITVESDKASMEIPSPAAGVIKELKVKMGDKVAEGTLMMVLEADGGDAVAPVAPVATPAASAPVASASAPTPKAEPTELKAPVAAVAETAAPAQAASLNRTPPVPVELHDPTASHVVKPHASPSVRMFSRELGVDLHLVRGTGPKQRITKEDVQNFVKNAVAVSLTAPVAGASKSAGTGGGMDVLPWPKVDFAKFGEIEELELSRIKKLSGPNLHRNWVMIPHVTQFDEADITDLEQFRKDTNTSMAKQGVKTTMLAFVIKACVAVLKKYPAFNSSLSENGDKLILKKFYNIGFAADTPNGLVVPVVKNADKKGVAEIAKELGDLAALARDGKLKGGDMQGATFTISSLGGVGGTSFTPIINAPEVAILGLSKSQIKPVWDGNAFVPRLMLPLSLSYDHRVVDGAQAAKFTTELAEVLADMRRVLL
ncbi:MAG: dihydrolipoyllysine-residue acetyltransferase [Limnobacter sp.]|nr:dihydrolipoyllysine-residue acetyltransferase [Limnobacter sp.]